MVKLKTILDIRRAKTDGTFPIMIRVTNHKEVKYLPIGISASKKQWDETTMLLSKHHPNATTINALISKRFYEVQKAILKLEEEEQYSFESLKVAIAPKETKNPVIVITFQTFANDVIADFIKVKRTGNALVYQTAVNRILNYSNNPNLKFQEIDYTFLDNFRNKLIQEGMKKNTVGNYFRSIRALYNKAIKAKVVAREFYPFHDISIKAEKTAKRAE